LYGIFCTFASLVKYHDSSFMSTFWKFAILIRFYCNCTMPTCCNFAFLVKSDFNSFMATFDYLIIIFLQLLVAWVFWHLIYFSRLLNYNLTFLENIVMFSTLFCFSSKYDMLRKVIWNKEELWVVWRFLPKCLWMCCNFVEGKCAHNWRGIYKVSVEVAH
jgi:hypothetical protein